MLILTSKWFNGNKFYGTMLLSLLSIIVYVSLVLSQYFYHFSMWETNNVRYNNIYYFTSDNVVTISEFDGFLSTMNNRELSPMAVSVAFGVGEFNNYLFSAPVLHGDSIMTWGELPQEKDEIAQFIVGDLYGELEVNGANFNVTGYGALSWWGADYSLSYEGFEEHVGAVSSVQLVFEDRLSNREIKQLNLIISDTFGDGNTLESFTGFNENAFSSRLNMMILSFVLIAVAVASTLFFIETIIRLQREDIFVFMLCGAYVSRIVFNYLITTLLFSLCSALVGLLCFYVTKELEIYNYSNFSSVVNSFIAITAFLIIVIISALFIIRKTVKSIANDYKEALV